MYLALGRGQDRDTPVPYSSRRGGLSGPAPARHTDENTEMERTHGVSSTTNEQLLSEPTSMPTPSND